MGNRSDQPGSGIESSTEYERAELLQAALRAVEAAAPASVEHRGKTYLIKTKVVMLDIQVFDRDAPSHPLAAGQAMSKRWTGRPLGR